MTKGEIRVGRIKYNRGRICKAPSFEGFTPFVVLTKKSSKYGSLGPYHLRNEKGQILENVWQFSKVYKTVPEVSIPFSSTDKTIVWRHGAETHVDKDGSLTPEYHAWRERGMNNPQPVRNPVGWRHMKDCLYALKDVSNPHAKLDYVNARKEIYIPIYEKSVVAEPLFKELHTRYTNGENILIIEVDGPWQEDLQYYKDKYGVSDSFIDRDTMLATPENLNIMLNDTKHPYGHGYVLANTLLTHTPQ